MRRTLQLAAVGTAAGLYSGLFGVGGGSVIVPLLILWLGYEAKEAWDRGDYRSAVKNGLDALSEAGGAVGLAKTGAGALGS